MNIRNVVAAGVAVWALGLGTVSVAQDYPTKPVELIVMFPPGSSADVVARLLADGMSRSLGQQVVVMNRPGAGGAIASRYVQSAKPDGYTMVFNSNSVSTVYYSGLTQFDYKAFDPVARTTVENPVIAVRADAPWKDLRELMAAAKKKPGDIKMGNSGTGSHTHFTAVAFFSAQQAEVLHVPFGASQVLTSLLGGDIDALVQLPSALAPMVKAGKLRILGTLASARDPAFPEVPTAIEQGFNYHAELWRGIAVPKGTPPQVVAKLEAAVKAAVNAPEFKAQGDKIGFLPAYQASKDFGATVAAEDAQIGALMAKTGLKLQ
jgi:tripartite-type tricarboxylate transporter receptor subunit TctC